MGEVYVVFTVVVRLAVRLVVLVELATMVVEAGMIMSVLTRVLVALVCVSRVLCVVCMKIERSSV